MDSTVLLPIMGEVDVDAIYRNPAIRLAKPRRKSGAMRKQCTMLDTESIARAKEIGGGNLSLGVRLALGQWKRSSP